MKSAFDLFGQRIRGTLEGCLRISPRRRAWSPGVAIDKRNPAGGVESSDSEHLPDTFFKWPDDAEPNLVTSKILDSNLHAPCIDLDIPALLIPSQTEGNSHLYLDINVSWENYLKLLEAMKDCGIIEKGYYKASANRGFTSLRMPWKNKKIEEQI